MQDKINLQWDVFHAGNTGKKKVYITYWYYSFALPRSFYRDTDFRTAQKQEKLSTSGWNKKKQKAIKTRQGGEEFQSLCDRRCSSPLLPAPLFVHRWQIRFSNSIFTSISSAVLPLRRGHCAYLCHGFVCETFLQYTCCFLRCFCGVRRAERLTTVANVLTRYSCVSQVPLDLWGAFSGGAALACLRSPLRAPRGVAGRAERCISARLGDVANTILLNNSHEWHPRVHFVVMMNFRPAT